MPVVINLDVELAKRKMSVAELAAAIGITPANVFVLKSGRAKAVRFSTLEAICRVLGCQPGDLLAYEPAEATASETPVT
ncbi:helix-turn-helix transcriptional regulator [Microbacterium sp. W1N]|uniref:helix-turn-helix domain-containing protein n=1 Tax=Microbacterium festucae TaxID=2977531 RepID=UPI0021C0C306|nr:helix-turn-helix transcriptional regulator [Microbacterium festucae]MCT9820956.1 helix-turn-helix transcriptional regulator [Microbacterium festucae]